MAMGVPTAAMAGEHWKGARNGKAVARAHASHRQIPKPRTTVSAAPTVSATPKASATPTATASPTAVAGSSEATARVLALANAERTKAGCAALTLNPQLTTAAQKHSQDMAAHRSMSHTGSDGSSPGDRIKAAGYNAASWGENVAYGYSTPDAVMTAWMTSPGHRANIVDCSFKDIGIGLAQPGSYWTQDFGSRR
jgi:uncharacterized protein YkwD